jgi:hypothetical protein
MCSNGRSIMQSVLFLQRAKCWLVNRRALLPMGNQTRSLRVIAINSAFSLHEYKYSSLSCGAFHCVGVDDGNASLHSPSRLFLAVSPLRLVIYKVFFLIVDYESQLSFSPLLLLSTLKRKKMLKTLECAKNAKIF